MIERVLGVAPPLFRRVYVVARTRTCRDAHPNCPLTDARSEERSLAGLARGLATAEAERCFLAAADKPFLESAVIA